VRVEQLKGAQKAAMPTVIKPMLAILVDEAFDDDQWLYEVKFDGYRAVAFIRDGRLRLFSRNQNELTGEFPEIGILPKHVSAKHVILDGEICALDEEGRPSFSLMQQRTGYEPGKRRAIGKKHVPGLVLVYYVFDVLYLDGYSL